MNDKNDQTDGEAVSWSWNRSSKLKKRRRIMSPVRTNSVNNVTTSSSTSTGAPDAFHVPHRDEDIMMERNVDTNDDICGAKTMTTDLSAFLKLPSFLVDGSEKQRLGKSMAAELEYLIMFTQQQQQQQQQQQHYKNKTKATDDNLENVFFSSHLSFPSTTTTTTTTTTCNNNSRSSNISIGSNLTNDSLSFPNKRMQTNIMMKHSIHCKDHGLVRIVYPHGATIRRDYDIKERSSPPMGTLPYQALRCFVEKKWLSPPKKENMDLVPVLRYKILLMDSDSSSTDERHEDCKYGWISDRSRLNDDPYVIAECVVNM